MTAQELSKRKALLSDLIQMAYADNKLEPEEIEFILAVGKRMKVPEYELVPLIKSKKNDEFILPSNSVERFIHFHRIMLVMFIDGNVNDNELQFLREIALKYGYRHEVVSELIKAMKQYPLGEIPADELMKIHQRVYN